jgi:hypothetical protein
VQTLKQKLSKAKVHLKIPGVDARNQGQTQFEYEHQAACGYVRDLVSANESQVTCFFCQRKIKQK